MNEGLKAEPDSSAPLASYMDRCRKTLPDLSRDLRSVIAGREDVFLRLGSEIQQVAARSGELADKGDELAGLASGEEISRCMDRLSTELESMRRVCDADQSALSIKDLTGVCKHLAELDSRMQGFRGIVRTLTMLGISTRIESARLGSAGRGFATLADDVEKLANNIVAHSAQVTEETTNLQSLVDKALDQTKIMNEIHTRCSQTVLVSIGANLEALTELVRRSGRVSDGLKEKTRSIARNMGEVVSSVQFHDITRQQVEHVEEALSDILKMMEDYSSHEDKASLRAGELVAWTGDVVSLQRSQLENASNRFFQAMETLRQGLGDIGGDVDEAVSMVGEITAGSGRDGVSILREMEESIGDTVENMRRYMEQGAEMGKLMSSVAETVEEMTREVEEIEGVGYEIELISMNASIRAAHTGNKGRALGVLASSIQGLSKEAGEQTEAIGQVLGRVREAAEFLHQRADAFSDTTQAEATLESLDKSMGDLKIVNTAMDRGFEETRERGLDLTTRVNGLAESLVTHHEVSRELKSIAGLFNKLESEAVRLAPQEAGNDRARRLEELLNRYTMDAERLVHGSETGQASEAYEGASGEEDAELWDNVELF